MALTKKTIKWLEKKGISSLKGKRVLITGSNSGVGFKMAETMVYLGAEVIMACRNLEKAEAAKETLTNQYKDANVLLMKLDIASLDSIDSFVKTMEDERVDVDVFINNAGIFHIKGETADGFEAVLGTNYIGTYYLCEKLLPYLKGLGHKVQLVNTISLVHKIGTIDYKDFYCSKRYKDFKVYARSKIALAKYTYDLYIRNKGTNVSVLMNHPGISITPIALKAFGNGVYKAANVIKGMFNSPEKSSLSVALLMSKEYEGGSIIGPNALFGGWGYPKLNHTYKKVKTGAKELIEFTNSELRNHGRVL